MCKCMLTLFVKLFFSLSLSFSPRLLLQRKLAGFVCTDITVCCFRQFPRAWPFAGSKLPISLQELWQAVPFAHRHVPSQEEVRGQLRSGVLLVWATVLPPRQIQRTFLARSSCLATVVCDGRVGQSVIWVLRAQERPVIAPPISSFPSVAFDLSQTETAASASVAKTYHGSLIDP